MNWKPAVEAIIYVTEEPVTAEQIAGALAQAFPDNAPSKDDIRAAIGELMTEYQNDGRGIEVKEVAGGFKMATKPEHHETVRQFVKSLKPPIRLSLAALETLAVIAYRQPVTVPEIQDIRGVNAAGVIKTLLDKKLITTAGRKEVMGRPVLYKTTKEFLVQFGLKDLSELPSLKEFEELSKAAMLETEPSPEESNGQAGAEGEEAEQLELNADLPSPDEGEQAEAAEAPAEEAAEGQQPEPAGTEPADSAQADELPAESAQAEELPPESVQAEELPAESVQAEELPAESVQAGESPAEPTTQPEEEPTAGQVPAETEEPPAQKPAESGGET